MFLCLVVAALLRAVYDQKAEVMCVVPVVLRADILALHVVLVYSHRIKKYLARSLVVPDAIKNVARHVNHVSGRRGKRPQLFGAVKRPFRMAASLDRMDPVMVGSGVVRMRLKNLPQ